MTMQRLPSETTTSTGGAKLWRLGSRRKSSLALRDRFEKGAQDVDVSVYMCVYIYIPHVCPSNCRRD